VGLAGYAIERKTHERVKSTEKHSSALGGHGYAFRAVVRSFMAGRQGERHKRQ
jgi:hypothetical protein